MKNKIEDLRNHLFAQLERLSDPDCKLDEEIKRSAAIVEVSNAIVETAAVENEFLRIVSNPDSTTNGIKSDFMQPKQLT